MPTTALLIKAIKNKELSSYLVGKGEYNSINPYSETPTDALKAFERIADYYFREKSILNNFIASLEKMSSDRDYGWFSLYFFLAFARFVTKENIDFDLLSLWTRIKNNVNTQEANLTNDKRWVGAMWPNGLWGDVLRMIKNIEEEIQGL
jgi:hypothetical protein